MTGSRKRCTAYDDKQSHNIIIQSTENEHCFWLGMWTAEMFTVLLAGVLGTSGRGNVSGLKLVLQQMFVSPSVLCSSRDHARPPKLSFALAKVLGMNARRFREHICGVEWEIIHSTRQRMLVSKLLTSRLLVDLNQWLMEYVLQWLAQIVHVAYLTQVPVARTKLLRYAVLARDDTC